MKAEEIGQEFAEVAEGCASEAFAIMREIVAERDNEHTRGYDDDAEFLRSCAERAARVSSLLKVASVLEGLSLIGLLECPECGKVFNACHHRANESRQSVKESGKWER